ncbi:hypothetical protein RFI_13404, partial [Reticulomyxa filosa]
DACSEIMKNNYLILKKTSFFSLLHFYFYLQIRNQTQKKKKSKHKYRGTFKLEIFVVETNFPFFVIFFVRYFATCLEYMLPVSTDPGDYTKRRNDQRSRFNPWVCDQQIKIQLKDNNFYHGVIKDYNPRGEISQVWLTSGMGTNECPAANILDINFNTYPLHIEYIASHSFEEVLPLTSTTNKGNKKHTNQFASFHSVGARVQILSCLNKKWYTAVIDGVDEISQRIHVSYVKELSAEHVQRREWLWPIQYRIRAHRNHDQSIDNISSPPTVTTRNIVPPPFFPETYGLPSEFFNAKCLIM